MEPRLKMTAVNVVFEGAVCGKPLMRTWCMQPIACTCEQLQRIQRTRHWPIVRRVVSLPLDKQYTGLVQVCVDFDSGNLTVELLQLICHICNLCCKL